MMMREHKREILTNALVGVHLKEIRSDYDTLETKVTAWLCDGLQGYDNMSDGELLDCADDEGWEELGLFEEDFRPSATENGVANLNWYLLQEQKQHLIKMCDGADFDTSVTLSGVIHMIDAIQDNAVKDGLAPEDVVFVEVKS